MKKITIDIPNEGDKVEVDWEGYQGKLCFEEADKLKRILSRYGISWDGYNGKAKQETVVRNEPIRIKRF